MKLQLIVLFSVFSTFNAFAFSGKEVFTFQQANPDNTGSSLAMEVKIDSEYYKVKDRNSSRLECSGRNNTAYLYVNSTDKAYYINPYNCVQFLKYLSGNGPYSPFAKPKITLTFDNGRLLSAKED